MFPVLPDQLDVLWDVQAKPAQHFHYKICEPVCHAENSVQGHFSAGGVVRKELFECVIGFVVAYYFQLTMESAGEAAVLKAGFALEESPTGMPLTTLDTVPRATPASLATSFIVGLEISGFIGYHFLTIRSCIGILNIPRRCPCAVYLQ